MYTQAVQQSVESNPRAKKSDIATIIDISQRKAVQYLYSIRELLDATPQPTLLKERNTLVACPNFRQGVIFFHLLF